MTKYPGTRPGKVEILVVYPFIVGTPTARRIVRARITSSGLLAAHRLPRECLTKDRPKPYSIVHVPTRQGLGENFGFFETLQQAVSVAIELDGEEWDFDKLPPPQKAARKFRRILSEKKNSKA